MLFRAIAVGWVCAALADSAAGAERYPFQATVEVDEADVRSGPGEDFYPTAKLRRGDEVEVYRRDPGGWFAIRPPGGSFSWVPADEIDAQEDDLGEVLHDGVPSLVGSSVRQDRDISHVKLAHGEQVVILGSSRGGGDRWYKIMPPSGEFRWIHASDLGLENHDIRQERPREERPQEERPRKERPRQDRVEQQRIESVFPKTVPPAAAEQPSEQWHAAPRETMHRIQDKAPAESPRRSDAVGYASPTGWVPPSGSALAARESGSSRRDQAVGYGRSSYERSGHAAPRGDSPASPGDVDAALNAINIDLSKMVCRPRNRWSLTELRDRTKDVLRQADRPADRGRARRLLERIAQFEDVQNKSQGRSDEKLFTVSHKSASPDAGPPNPSESKSKRRQPAEPPAKATQTESAPGVLSSIDTSQYDGAGRLVPMQKRGPADPQYLLVDEHGLTRYFVTPAPGVNLRNYRDQFVGITGSRREGAALGKPLIMAQRVKLLSPK